MLDLDASPAAQMQREQGGLLASSGQELRHLHHTLNDGAAVVWIDNPADVAALALPATGFREIIDDAQ